MHVYVCIEVPRRIEKLFPTILGVLSINLQFHIFEGQCYTGWWFQTFFIFHNGIILPIDQYFFKMVKTTN